MHEIHISCTRLVTACTLNMIFLCKKKGIKMKNDKMTFYIFDGQV